MPGLTAVTGAVRAAIGGYANQAVRAGAEGIKNISGLPLEGNNVNVDDFVELNKKKSTTILTYPIDVATDAQQGHYILFMINERIPGKLAKNKGSKNIESATKKVVDEGAFPPQGPSEEERSIADDKANQILHADLKAGKVKSSVSSAGGRLNR